MSRERQLGPPSSQILFLQRKESCCAWPLVHEPRLLVMDQPAIFIFRGFQRQMMRIMVKIPFVIIGNQLLFTPSFGDRTFDVPLDFPYQLWLKYLHLGPSLGVTQTSQPQVVSDWLVQQNKSQTPLAHGDRSVVQFVLQSLGLGWRGILAETNHVLA